jgi:hypothetical protein
MNRLSSLLQFVLGFFLGVFLLLGGTAALGFVFLSRMTAPPPKPIFAEEKEKPVAEKPQPSPTATAEIENPQPTETVAEAEKEENKEELPPGAYQARVTWSEGLSLRATPGQDAERIGGVGYNSQLIILKTQGQWQQVRLPGSGQEGWIKAGNVEKVE